METTSRMRGSANCLADLAAPSSTPLARQLGMATRRGNKPRPQPTDAAETRVRTVVAPTGFEPVFQPREGRNEGCYGANSPDGCHRWLPATPSSGQEFMPCYRYRLGRSLKRLLRNRGIATHQLLALPSGSGPSRWCRDRSVPYALVRREKSRFGECLPIRSPPARAAVREPDVNFVRWPC